jgi:hypothetical protein
MPKRAKKTGSKKKPVKRARTVKNKNTIKKPPVKKFVTCTEFAKLMKVTPRAVQIAIGQGRLRAEKNNGTFRIDPVVGRADWLSNTLSQSKVVKGSKTPGDMSTADVERIEKFWKAKLAELKYREATKELVDVERVKRDAFETGRKIRDGMLSIPSRISSEVLGKRNQFEIEKVMTREIMEVLKLLSDGK